MKYSSILFFVLLAITACQKDDDQAMSICDIPPMPCEQKASFIPFQDTCFEYSFPDPGSSAWNLVGDIAYYYPVLSSLNAEYIMYTKIDTVQPIIRLKKLDFCSGEKELIYENLPLSGFGPPDWGENDWIVFTNADDGQLWKMKSNGDSLQRITELPNIVYRPIWINGSNNIFGLTRLNGNSNSGRYIFTPDGVIVDSIPIFFGYDSHWNGKLAIVDFTTSVIGSYNLNTEELYLSPMPVLQDVVTEMNWLDEDNIVFNERKVGLQRVNIQTGEVTMLIEECDNRQVFNITSSPLTDGIVYLTEIHNLILGDELYHNQWRIYKLDAYTGEQWLVDLED